MRPVLAFALAALITSPALAADADGAKWWSHVETLAGPQFEGRLTGSPGYDKAAAYAAERFKAYGLQPAGTDGYLQPMKFTVQRILADVGQQHVIARHRKDMRDAVAHLTCADHANRLNRHACIPCSDAGTIGRGGTCCNAKPPPVAGGRSVAILVRDYSFSVSSGTMVNRSPTRP